MKAAAAPWEIAACLLCRENRYRLEACFAQASYVRCASCGLVYLRPRLEEQAILRLYRNGTYFVGASDFGYEDYDAEAPQIRRTFERRLDELQPHGPRSGRLLDVGCGTGWMVEAALARGYDAHGLDPSDYAVARGRVRLGERLRVGTVEDLDGGPFDWILALDVFEHLYRPRDFLARARELLASGGRVAIATPNYDAWLRRLLGRRSISFKIPEHVAYYDRASLARAVRGIFRIVALRSIGQYCSSSFLERRLTAISPAIARPFAAGARVWESRVGPVSLYVPSGSLLAVLAALDDDSACSGVAP